MRDLSASGMLFHSLSGFDVGDRVTVRFELGESGSGSTTAKVVRTFCDLNADNLFRFVTALEFDAPLLDVESELSRLEERQQDLARHDTSECGTS
jgi:hypothetical protein